MDETEFRLELDLRTICMVSLAARVWDASFIKTDIKNYFSTRLRSVRRSKKWYEISRKAVCSFNSSALPTTILTEMQRMITVLGEKIHDWIIRVTKIYRLDFVFAEKIYWTPYGSIDEIRIFDLYWQQLRRPERSDYFYHSPMSSLACMYGHVSFIEEHRLEMMEELAPHINDSQPEDEIYNIMSVSISLTIRKNKQVFDIAGDDNEMRLEPFDMHQKCLDAGFSKAARYYWDRLDEIQRVSNISTFARNCLKGRKFNEKSDSFIQEKHCEMFVFLINQKIPEDEKRESILNNIDLIVFSFLPVWPYQELIPAFLDFVGTNEINLNSSQLIAMVCFILDHKKMKEENPSDCLIARGIHFEVFQRTWEKLPKITKYSSSFEIIDMVLGIYFDLHILGLMLNDEDINNHDAHVFKDPADEIYLEKLAEIEGNSKTKYKRHKAALVLFCCKTLAQWKRFHEIDTLTRSVLHSDKIRELFKRLHQVFIKELTIKYRMLAVDAFLDWISDSAEERSAMKNEISTDLCDDLIRSYDFDLADRFLKWRLETNEAVLNFKKKIKSDDFIVNYVLTNLRECDGNRKRTRIFNKCHRAINFFYPTDEEVIQFKRNNWNLFDDENFLHFFYESFKRTGPEINALLEFCSINIEEVKRKMRDGIEKYLDHCIIERRDVRFADYLMIWHYDQLIEAREARTKYINSPKKGALLCKSFFENSVNYCCQWFNKEAFKSWLNLIDDMERLKNDLFELEDNSSELFLLFLNNIVDNDVWSAVDAVLRSVD